MIRSLLHAIAHALNLNYGQVETYWSADRLWASFRCHECGKRAAAEPVPDHVLPW